MIDSGNNLPACAIVSMCPSPVVLPVRSQLDLERTVYLSTEVVTKIEDGVFDLGHQVYR